MIKPYSDKVIYICDCCRAEVPGISVPSSNNSGELAVLPTDWHRVQLNRRGLRVERIYCPACYERKMRHGQS